MNNEGERSKALVVRLGILGNKLTFYRYGIPKSVVAELEELRKEMNADKILRELGSFYFEVLDDLFLYVDAKNAGKKELADGYMAQAEAKWDKIESMLSEVGTVGD